MVEIMFFHGLESGPYGSKFQALESHFGTVSSPDFRGMDDIEERYQYAELLTRDKQGLLLVGSSFGGLLAALLADRHPERVAGYVLAAPALHRDAAKNITRVPRVVILHGRKDAVVPAKASIDFSRTFEVPMVLVSDNHRLGGSQRLLVALVDHMRAEIIKAS